MEEDEERIMVVKTEAAEEEEEVNDYKDRDLMEAAAEEGEEVKREEEEEDKKPLRGLMLKRKIDGVIGERKIIANCFARFGCKHLNFPFPPEPGRPSKKQRPDNNPFESSFSAWSLGLSTSRCEFECSDCGEVATGSASMRTHALMSHRDSRPKLVLREGPPTLECSLCKASLPKDAGCFEDHLSRDHPEKGGLRGYFRSEVYTGPPSPPSPSSPSSEIQEDERKANKSSR